MLLYQLYLGISNNFTKSIFGICSSELLSNNINVKNNNLNNYIKSIGIKKFGHILQGVLIGSILLLKLDISNILLKIFNKNKCIQTNYQIILPVALLSVLILWQLNIISIIFPIILGLLVFKIIYDSCKEYQKNIIISVLSCGYILYNLGKRSYNPAIFIESSYFSNLFDFFIGLTISIIIFSIKNKENKQPLKINPIIIYSIIFIFISNTFIVKKLINFSKLTFNNNDSIQQLQQKCK